MPPVFCRGCFIFSPCHQRMGPSFSMSSPAVVSWGVLIADSLLAVRQYLTAILISISLVLSDVGIFSCVCWPFVCLLWRKRNGGISVPNSLPILKLNYLFLVKCKIFVNILWILTPHWMYDSFPIP